MRQPNMRTEAHEKRETCAPVHGAHAGAAHGHREGHVHEAGARPQAKATGIGQAPAPRGGPKSHGDGPRNGAEAASDAPGFRSGRPNPKAGRPTARGLHANVDKPRRGGHRTKSKDSARTDAAPSPMLTSHGTDVSAGPMLTMLTRRPA